LFSHFDFFSEREIRSMSMVSILVVDDIDSWRRFVTSTLGQEPSFEIICEVSDGVKAVQMAEQLQPTVVLLDIGLPRLNGIEAGKWIREVAPNAKIVFLSEQLDSDIIQAALKLGAGGYVLKSDAAKDLVAAIHAVVRGKKFVSARLTGHA
jgi:two-component system nitrate/nitrite response regulator NarL